MKTIELGLRTRRAERAVALIDDEDYLLVAAYRWHLKEDRRARTEASETATHEPPVNHADRTTCTH